MNDLQRFFICFPTVKGRWSRMARMMRRSALSRAYGEAHAANGSSYREGEAELIRVWNAEYVPLLGSEARRAYAFEQSLLRVLKHPEYLTIHVLPNPGEDKVASAAAHADAHGYSPTG